MIFMAKIPRLGPRQSMKKKVLLASHTRADLPLPNQALSRPSLAPGVPFFFEDRHYYHHQRPGNVCWLRVERVTSVFPKENENPTKRLAKPLYAKH